MPESSGFWESAIFTLTAQHLFKPLSLEKSKFWLFWPEYNRP